MDTDARLFAALNMELAPDGGDAVPGDAHLLPPGPFRASDGRPRDLPAWQLDAAIAAAVVARAANKRGDTLIDYEHQSLHAEWNGQPAPAAGWFNALEWREGKGLYAAGIRWTERARGLIASREYRYISAVFSYYPATGEVLEIVSVALTNTPALDGLDALIAARHIHPTPEEHDMADAHELAALKTERDGLKAELAALKARADTIVAERDEALKKEGAASAELAEIKAKAAEAALAVEKAERAKLLEGIPPALRPALDGLALDALKAYADAAAPLGLLTQQADGHAKPAAAALTKEEAAYCEKLGVAAEDYLKAKE